MLFIRLRRFTSPNSVEFVLSASCLRVFGIPIRPSADSSHIGSRDGGAFLLSVAVGGEKWVGKEE